MFYYILTFIVLSITSSYVFVKTEYGKMKLTTFKSWALSKFMENMVNNFSKNNGESILSALGNMSMSKEDTATAKGKYLYVKYIFHGEEYCILVPYDKRAKKQEYFVKHNNDLMEKVLHHHSTPFLVNPKMMGAKEIHVVADSKDPKVFKDKEMVIV